MRVGLLNTAVLAALLCSCGGPGSGLLGGGGEVLEGTCPYFDIEPEQHFVVVEAPPSVSGVVGLELSLVWGFAELDYEQDGVSYRVQLRSYAL